MNQSVGQLNDEYWSYLCGSRAAKKLGITPADPAGVSRFDRWFFEFYPYIDDSSVIPWDSIKDMDTLEIGLGYGSMSRRLAASGKSFIGCDISSGPVSFLRKTSNRSAAIQGSAVSLPLRDESVDLVISIGCLHHTGALEKSLDECMRVLRPNGTLVVMVYFAYSYKQWILAPISTFKRKAAERRNVIPTKSTRAKTRLAFFYDRNQEGKAPPFTEFVSRKQIEQALVGARDVRTVVTNLDNIGDLLPLSLQSTLIDRLRIALLRMPFLRRCGLDLYVIARK